MADLDEDHGEKTPQEPCGLRNLPREHPWATNCNIHVVVTGEPGAGTMPSPGLWRVQGSGRVLCLFRMVVHDRLLGIIRMG
jgi:hypothetical protein